jgi:hypothetical protein
LRRAPATTHSHGRTDQPLLAPRRHRSGRLRFVAGALAALVFQADLVAGRRMPVRFGFGDDRSCGGSRASGADAGARLELLGGRLAIDADDLAVRGLHGRQRIVPRGRPERRHVFFRRRGATTAEDRHRSEDAASDSHPASRCDQGRHSTSLTHQGAFRQGAREPGRTQRRYSVLRWVASFARPE